MMRLAWGVVVAACAALLAACGGSDAAFPEDLRGSSHATYVEEPDVYRTEMLRDPWVKSIPLGRSTFGREIPRIIRIEIDGAGRLQDRDISLQTRPTVALFNGPGEQRMKQFVHGMLSMLDERGGLVRGIAITSSRASFEAAAISPIIEDNLIDGRVTRADRAFLNELLGDIAKEQAEYALAWYFPRSTWMTIGNDIGAIIRRHAATPKRVKPADGIYAAYILRHEMEHAVTAADFEQNERFDWIEEGGADMLATWPGQAALTARRMGLPYPKRYEQQRYETRRAGYAEWRNAMYLLVQAAGVDTTSARSFDAANELIQTKEPRFVPRILADAIATEQGLSPARRAKLVRQVTNLDGDARATRRLVAAWL